VSGPSELPGDQVAAVALLLRQRRGYADVARLLGIEEQAVIARARAALDRLAPQETTPPSPAERVLVGDYLLGQLAGPAAASAERRLSESRAARVWARGVAQGLQALVPGAVPAIPGAVSNEPAPGASAPSTGGSPPGRAPAPARALRGAGAGAGETASRVGQGTARSGAQAPTTAAHGEAGATAAAQLTRNAPARGRAGPIVAGQAPGPAGPQAAAPPMTSSRAGGAILLMLMAALVVAAVVLVTRSGSGVGQGVVTGAARGATASGSTVGSPFRVLASAGLTAGPAGGGAQGAAEIVSEGGQRAMVVAGQRLAPATGVSRGGQDYVLWLSGPAGAQELGVAQPVAGDGVLQAFGALPARGNRFTTVLITRETASRPASPGPVVLRGRLPGS
jgi:hypothetical protein